MIEDNFKILRLLTFLASLSLACLAIGQESVQVPQVLQRNVFAFKLSVDSLEAISSDLYTNTAQAMQQLRIMQRKMQLLPGKSRAYQLHHKQYEQKLSEYWARKYTMLQQMQDLRMRTLTSLDHVLRELESTDSKTDKKLAGQVQDEIRRMADRMSQARLEMLQILDTLKKDNRTFEEKKRLTRRFYLLKNDNLALWETHRARLAELHELSAQPNRRLPAMLQSLLAVRDDLESRYGWVETEMVYLNLYATYRRQWLEVDSKLLEVTDLTNRFSDLVNNLNRDQEQITEVEGFERELRSGADSTGLFVDLPPLQWPGKPEHAEEYGALTPGVIDSLRNVLERDLSATTANESNERIR